ncbi:hypothetical protein D3C77_505410 [compost metagenome]|jgi:hypothetical protein
MDTTIEDARYAQILLEGIQTSFYGKHEEVEGLIEYGVYIKDAATIIRQGEEASRAPVLSPAHCSDEGLRTPKVLG